MKAAFICCLLASATADLRQASQPKEYIKRGRTVRGPYDLYQIAGGRGLKGEYSPYFAVGTAQNADGTVNNEPKANGQAQGRVLYMEPSTFGYKGLKNQRAKNYDNFLRSNIDNEQDNRDFRNEPGLDHLPFRTYESAVETKYPYKGKRPGDEDDSLQVNQETVDTVLRVKAGEPRLTPLRWNNPHASEIEVNLWIMCSDPPTIVPIKKPTCSGEGHQNNIIEWAIPRDFNDVNWGACPSTKCFSGCNSEKDCVLQIYAHSVETRTYSTSVPIIVSKEQWTGRTLPYKPVPQDAAEADSYAWPTTYDLKAMVSGNAPQPATSIYNIKICASSANEGVDKNGLPVTQVQLDATTAKTLNAPNVHFYLCRRTKAEQASVALVNKVIFRVSSSDTVTGTFTEHYKKILKNAPYSVPCKNCGAAVKKVQVNILSFTGQRRTVAVLLDLRGNGQRWRFRRHLQAVCANGLPEPFPDPWMDLSKLKRETCMSAQDPHANFAKTQIQRAVLHSDQANHAYQNSNYSPYSGQQHGEISRNLQAAAVVHMTAGNRGELGRNSLNTIKATQGRLHKKVNKIYKAYEKIANKVIDAISKTTGGRNGGDVKMGVQQLATAFRAAEKGATSNKRLKTTTYVPSFSTANYDLDVIQATIKNYIGDGVAKYADVLSAPKPNTNIRYIEIYQATMNHLLPDFAHAAHFGITYQESVKKQPCSTLPAALRAKSTGGAKAEATPCCTGSMQDTGPGQCGATLTDVTQFRKKTATGARDSGHYAYTKFTLQRHMALYSCPAVCLMHNTKRPDAQYTILTHPIIKTSYGTCIRWDAGKDGCVAAKTSATDTDCRPCAGIFTNVDPATFQKLDQPSLNRLVKRVGSAGCTGCHYVETWPAPNAVASPTQTTEPTTKTPEPTTTTSAPASSTAWETLGSNDECDAGAGEVYMSQSSGVVSDLATCQKLCEEEAGCKSITFFHDKWCSHFSTECTRRKSAPEAISKLYTGPVAVDMVSKESDSDDDDEYDNEVDFQSLAVDDTAACHTVGKITCPGKPSPAQFEHMIGEGKCVDEPSTKIDGKCDDGPCDNDPESRACLLAKGKCEVDPDSGAKCIPGNENDPCADCVRTVASGGQAAAVAFTFLLFAFVSY